MSVLFLLLPYLFIIINSVYSFRIFNKKEKNLAPDTEVKKPATDVNEDLIGQFPKLKESGPDRITNIMSKYLANFTPCTREICKRSSTTCLELIQLYTNRCLEGDCYTFDHVKLVEFPNGLSIFVPSLTQVLFARLVFDVSKARATTPMYNIYKALYWQMNGNPRSIESFNKNLIKHNLNQLGLVVRPVKKSYLGKANFNKKKQDEVREKAVEEAVDESMFLQTDDKEDGLEEVNNPEENNSEDHSNDNNNTHPSTSETDRIILTESLYNFTLHYLTFLFKHPVFAERCKHKFFRVFFRWFQRTKLIQMVRNIAKVKVVGVGMRDLRSLIDSYTLYLNMGVSSEHYTLNRSYTRLVKHAIIKVAGGNRIGYLMSDHLMRFPVSPSSYCGGNSPANCYVMMMKYFDRCEDGDCLILDQKMLLDGKDPLNIGLPQLNQLDLVFHLFTNSRAHKSGFLDMILHRKGRLDNYQFGELLVARNTKKLKYSSKDHEILSKYLYFDTISFKIWTLKSKFSRFFGKGVDKQIKSYLETIMGTNPILIPKNVLEAIFAAYRNYMFQSKTAESKDTVVKFVQSCFDTLMSYNNKEKLFKLSKKHDKEKVPKGPEEPDMYKPVVSFNWEKENLKDYEKGEWVKVAPHHVPAHLRALDLAV